MDTTTRLDGSSWWRWRRVLCAALCAVVVAVVAFTFRFNSLTNGSLGGFTNDHFVHLLRVEMLLRGEQPLRDFADAEMQGAWPALSYAASAWAQQIGGRTLLPEAYLTVGALALANAVLFLLVLDGTRRWALAWLATTLCVAMVPRLYSYHKLLMLTFGAVAIRAVTKTPSASRLCLAAITTSVATLFRHDYGIYVGSGVIAGLIARDAGGWPVAGRRVATYIGMTALCLLPSAVWVQVYEGIPSYVSDNLVTAGLEASRTELNLPPLTMSALFRSDSLDALTYYAFWGTVVAAAAILTWRVLSSTSPLTREDRGYGAGLLAMAVITNEFLLRSPLTVRLGDAVVPVAVLAAWSVGALWAVDRPLVRRLVTSVPIVLLIFMFGAFWVFGNVNGMLDDSGLSRSSQAVARQFREIRDNLRRLPPSDWLNVDAEGPLAAARYLAECSSPDDYVLVAGDIPEIAVFARRRFAAGQAVFAKWWYASDTDQRRALARLASQSVPIIVADATAFETEIVSTYPLLARYMADHYRLVGTIADESKPLLVFADTRRKASRMDPHLGLPCFQ